MKDEDEDIAAIVSLIYETLFAPKAWGSLIESDSTGSWPAGKLGTASLQFLVPFLERALTSVNSRMDAASEDALQSNLLQELPLAVCIVSRDLRLLSATKKAHELFDLDSALCLTDGIVHATNRGLQHELTDAVSSAIESKQSHTLAAANESGGAQTFLAGPIAWGSGQSAAVLFLNIELGVFDRLSASLVESYGLTESEAEVTSHLAQGLSIEKIAEIKGRPSIPCAPS